MSLYSLRISHREVDLPGGAEVTREVRLWSKAYEEASRGKGPFVVDRDARQLSMLELDSGTFRSYQRKNPWEEKRPHGEAFSGWVESVLPVLNFLESRLDTSAGSQLNKADVENIIAAVSKIKLAVAGTSWLSELPSDYPGYRHGLEIDAGHYKLQLTWHIGTGGIGVDELVRVLHSLERKSPREHTDDV